MNKNHAEAVQIKIVVFDKDGNIVNTQSKKDKHFIDGEEKNESDNSAKK